MFEVHCGSSPDPVDVWVQDPRRVEKARALLAEAHAVGRFGADALQFHALLHSWDPETVHLAVALEMETTTRPRPSTRR